MNSNYAENNVKKGDVFLADLGKIVKGSNIQGGLRPAVVVQNDIGNKYSPTTTIVPLTGRVGKRGFPVHVFIKSEDSCMNKDSVALCEQARTIDKKDLKTYLGSLNDSYIDDIDGALRVQILS